MRRLPLKDVRNTKISDITVKKCNIAKQPFILTDGSIESYPKQTPTTDMKHLPLKDTRDTKISDITVKKCNNAKQPFILTDSSIESYPKQSPTTDMKRLPLKDVRNTKISDITVKKCSSETDTSKKEQLLNKVKLQWTTGKGRHQTSQCFDTVRECLKNDIPRDEINASIVSDMLGEALVVESRRAGDCIKRSLKNLNTVRKSKTMKDEREVATIQFPFQRNGCLSYIDEDGSKVCRAIQSDSVAIITPSNSSEEADTISDANDAKSNMQAHSTTLLGHSVVKDKTDMPERLVEVWKNAKSDVNTLKEDIKEENDEEVKTELVDGSFV